MIPMQYALRRRMMNRIPQLFYYGLAPELSVKRERPVATSVGNYALFGGGHSGTDYLSTVDAYDTSLTRTTPTALSVARDGLSATTVGNYALFGGGYNGTDRLSTVDAYQVKQLGGKI